MSEPHRFPILFCCDGNPRARQWLDYSLSSLFLHYDVSAEIEVFVASTEPYKRDGVTWIDANPYIEQFSIARLGHIHGHHLPSMTYMRLVSPWMYEFLDKDTVFYCDLDTVFCGRGITNLSICPEADAKVVFEESDYVENLKKELLSTPELVGMMSAETKERLGQTKGYFNAGIMLLNLSRLRKKLNDPNKWIPQMMELAARLRLRCADQDILNCVLDVEEMDTKFNVMPNCHSTFCSGPPEIIHFANPEKYESDEYPPPRLRQQLEAIYGNILG